MSLLPVDTAKARLLDSARPVEDIETVALAQADGRVLATDLAAMLTQPPFDASAMDGYAFRFRDAPAAGSELTVIGTSAAGHGFDGIVDAGETVRIFTGAPVPPGADTVLLQEDAEVLDGGRIRTTFAPEQGRHIRPNGQDFTLGETALLKGSVLDFTRLTLAAAMNHATLAVWRKPLVAIVATGDELASPGEIPGPNRIVASSTFGIAALARNAGADVLDLGIVPDDQRLISAAVDKARAARADVLVTLGGASVGDHDLVQAALVESGMQLDFWKIAMRPGKPLMVGSLDGMHVLGLPGNPVSSLVCGLLFLEPLLRLLAHLPAPARMSTALAGQTLKANDHRQDYLRATLGRDSAGALIAESFGKQDSSMMKIMAQSDCLIVRPPHAPELPAGAACPVLLLRPV